MGKSAHLIQVFVFNSRV